MIAKNLKDLGLKSIKNFCNYRCEKIFIENGKYYPTIQNGFDRAAKVDDINAACNWIDDNKYVSKDNIASDNERKLPIYLSSMLEWGFYASIKEKEKYINKLGFSVEKRIGGYWVIEYNGIIMLGDSADEDSQFENSDADGFAAIFLEHVVGCEDEFRKDFFEEICEDKEDYEEVIEVKNAIDAIYSSIHHDMDRIEYNKE